MSDTLCWCASDARCPHGISQRIPALIDDVEKTIDDILQQFDRKSIRRFLKKGVDGTTKTSNFSQMKDAYKTPDDVKTLLEKSARDSNSDLLVASRKRRSDEVDLSKSTPLPSIDNRELKRAATASDLRRSKIDKSKDNGDYFRRDMLSASLPKISPSSLQQSRKHAWSSSRDDSNDVTAEDDRAVDESHRPGTSSALEKTNPMNPLQAETVIAAGLMRIADQLARIVLPWQAVLCPRAVESLQDMRLMTVQARHNAFMQQMKQKLEEKVMNFLRKKEEEVDAWFDAEIKVWQEFLGQDETDLSSFLKNDLQRLSQRAVSQDVAYRRRELLVANDLDDHERDQTRDQLANFRRIVRAAKQPTMQSKSLFEQEERKVEVQVLQDSIAKGQGSLQKKAATHRRLAVRKQEESHDWLCSLADNAITAAISEEKVKELYIKLDGEKSKSMDSLQNALSTYKEQHNSIMEAIVVFAGRIHQHASDFLQREQLVLRSFLSYIISIISGEIKSHSGDQKKSSYAWETKALIDRGVRKEQNLIAEFYAQMTPLNKMVSDFKDKMKIQLDYVTMKLQSIINGKENDINARKSVIHKKLARHVNKACNARRQRLKDATIVRRDEYELESLAISKVDELCQDLRSAIDNAWVKEHLKERKIYEASLGRLERLEKSALIIWNKHTQLTSDEQEDYQEWLLTYKQDRDYKIRQRKQQIEQDYAEWRKHLGIHMKSLAQEIRSGFKQLVPRCLVYDVSVNMEDNIYDIEQDFEHFHESVLNVFQRLRGQLEEYINDEVNRIDETRHFYHHNLLQEWREQLFRLDSAINRKIGGLKDMEADLEETVRLTILQHEVENGIFEQLSCARMEHFWIDWRNKSKELAKELTIKQEDYEVAKRMGAAKTRLTKEERALEDIVEMAKEPGTVGGKRNSAVESPSKKAPTTSMKSRKSAPQPEDNEPKSDTMRLKIILDDISAEVYRDFTHRITRGLERVKRDLGEGKRQFVPAYAVAKVIAMNCERFYEKAQLNERCVGRISFRGVLLFKEGLPMFAKSTFTLAATCSILHFIPPRYIRDYNIDVDELFHMLDNVKVFFMIGLLTITSQYGEFGEYIMRSEALWLCSVMDRSPPADLLQASLAKGLKENIPSSLHPSGVYSEDTVDLFNGLIELPTDIEAVTRLKDEQQRLVEEQNKLAMVQDDERSLQKISAPLSVSNSFVGEGNVHFANLQDQSSKPSLFVQAQNSQFSEDPSRAQAYVTEPQDVYSTLQGPNVSLDEQMSRLRPSIAEADCFMLACLQGRPNGNFDSTLHKVCQSLSIWRRTSISIAALALSPPSTEYPRMQDIIAAHNAAVTGRKRMGPENINCVSPYAAISTSIDYLTSIHGLPISFLQATCMLGNGGSVDPWLEDPKQSCRQERLMYEVQEFLSLLSYRIPKSMIHDEYLQVVLPKNIEAILKQLDMNFSGNLPLEIVRTYLQRDDQALTNSQLSMIFWSLCRTNEEFDDAPQPPAPTAETGDLTNALVEATNSLTSNSFHSGGSEHRPIVTTNFHADPEDYMLRFGQDVDRYLQSMPTIDTNVVLGYLPTTLSAAAAHQLVSDAMKLDPSARNPMPSSCCIWLGQRIIQLRDALSALCIPGKLSQDGNFLVGISEKAFGAQHVLLRMQRDPSVSPAAVSREMFISKLRTFVEVDLLSKYPEICEIAASDRHYGPAGNDPMVQDQNSRDDFHWKELLQRRLNRLDRLTVSWRDLMLSEWASSLYASRQMRFQQRVHLVHKSVSVYHNQYNSLKEAMLASRGGFMSLFRGLENELIASVQDDYSLITYHTSFIDRALRRFEGEFARFWTISRDMLCHFIAHAGKIKRFGIDKVIQASEELRVDLEKSCTGLIVGYTAGFAQTFFDGLLQRGEVWRQRLTEVQSELIVRKELFMSKKDEIDRDMTIQISDRLSLDRTRSKDHLDALNAETAQILDVIATTRASYAALQKDANARLILRIEKAIRDSRKLRAAAENEPEIEGAVMRDIREVLYTAKNACIKIMQQIKEDCVKQIQSLEPLRASHRDKMSLKVKKIEKNWQEVAVMVYPLVDDYEFQVMKQLHQMNAHAMEYVHAYCEHESAALHKQYHAERAQLVHAFRKHFREYDLHELAIFERYDMAIHSTVNEMISLWGPSRPKFIKQALKELESIANESLQSSQQDIQQQMFLREIQDDFSCSRFEFADVFSFHMLKSFEYLKQIRERYVKEKEDQVVFIEEMSTQRNGDMVRPQVQAVLDLLISGIEIDSDFQAGFDNLVAATSVKTRDSETELEDFVARYSRADYPVSIPHTAQLTRQRIDSRKAEVDALLDASHAHIVADHSKLEVLINAGRKDIDEWFTLTAELIENAFHNAELNYLSNIWPTPEPTPRLELVSEDEDRVGKLKALLAQTQRDRDRDRDGERDRSPAAPLGNGALSPEKSALASYKGDAAFLLQSLQPTEDEEEEFRVKRDRKKEEKERRRRDAEDAEEAKRLAAQGERQTRLAHLPDGMAVPELRTRELQDGWFECVAPEGYVYFHNPATDESLWDLPQAMKKPKRRDDDDENAQGKERLIETPRELLMLEAANMLGQETVPIRVVPASFSLSVAVDPKVVMSEVAEESRAIAAFVTDTALDVTDLIHGRKGRDEQTIAALLGDRFDPAALKKFQLDYDSDAEDARDKHRFKGEEAAEEDARDAAERETDEDRVSVMDNGRVLPSQSGAELDPELNAMLRELGIGTKPAAVAGGESSALLALENGDEHGDAVPTPHEIVQPAQWLSLGFGEASTQGDREEDSSDGEEYTGFREDAKRRKVDAKYAQQREIDLMMREDDLSIAVENALENDGCHAFLERLTAIIESETATDEDKRALHAMAAKIKPANLLDIMRELETSWQEIDEIVIESKEREIERQRQAEASKTREGLQRQRLIVEHAEDIQEMANFLFGANLSKQTAKRVATELVLKQIATPKKLAKTWSRQQISLAVDLALDSDDVEELEQALQALLMPSTAGLAGNLHALDSFSGAIGGAYLGAGYSPFVSTAHMTSDAAAQQSYDYPAAPHNSAYDFQYLVEPTLPTAEEEQSLYAAQQSAEQPTAEPAPRVGLSASKSMKRLASLRLDPSVVTEVEYEDDDEDQSHSSAQSRPATAPEFVITKEGYKSFRGGWIEGTTEHNETYYWNVKTGLSAWNLPDLLEHEDEPVQSVAIDDAAAVDPAVDGAAAYGEQSYEGAEQEQPRDANYDEYYGEYADYSAPADEQQQQQQSSSWRLSDALGVEHIEDFAPPPKPRALPSYGTLEVAAYSKREGVARQLSLLQQQDRWQNALVKTQSVITEQKSQFLEKRVEMFDRVTERVDARLNAFIEDIKFMQKTLKKELGEANATERDLRRLFEEEPSTADIAKAEKLSFVLEALEKLKVSVSEKYDSAFKQIDKFAAEWELIKSELLQIGDIYDEGVLSNLAQCKLACEHHAKLFVKDQIKQCAHFEKIQLRLFRIGLRKELLSDTLDEECGRAAKRAEQLSYYYDRERKKESLRRELYPQSMGMNETISRYLEEELANHYQSFPIDPLDDMLTEEELCMSFMLQQIEMEHSLEGDYESILQATKSMAQELQSGLDEFDDNEKSAIYADGSWFNKHRDTLERHEQALHVTLDKVRTRMNEGYQILQTRIEALDYDVERAAEEELFQGSSASNVLEQGSAYSFQR